jgi:hypothetical protein
MAKETTGCPGVPGGLDMKLTAISKVGNDWASSWSFLVSSSDGIPKVTASR